MSRATSTKWERSYAIRPTNNIISSDFPKYQPAQWKFMDGKAPISLVLANEYQRQWATERDAWQQRTFPDNETQNVDVVKRYVLTFKANYQPPKPDKKKLFKIKKFEAIQSKTTHTRPPGDKALRKKGESIKK